MASVAYYIQFLNLVTMATNKLVEKLLLMIIKKVGIKI